MKKRKDHAPEFKAKVALVAIREELALAELSKKYGVHPTQIGTWKRAAIENMATTFARRGAAPEQASAVEVDKLLFGQCLAPVARDARQKMISKDHKLSVRRQSALLTLARSNHYYEPKGKRTENLRHGNHRQAGLGDAEVRIAPNGTSYEAQQSRMRLVPIYQEPNTSKKHPQHKIWPYLLRNVVIDRPSQVWCADRGGSGNLNSRDQWIFRATAA